MSNSSFTENVPHKTIKNVRFYRRDIYLAFVEGVSGVSVVVAGIPLCHIVAIVDYFPLLLGSRVKGLSESWCFTPRAEKVKGDTQEPNSGSLVVTEIEPTTMWLVE